MSIAELFYGNPYPEKYYIYSLHKPLTMKCILSFLFLFSFFTVQAQKEKDFYWTKKGVFKITVHLKSGNSLNGTAFIAKYKGNIFFVTARHLFQGYENNEIARFDVHHRDTIVREMTNVFFDPNPDACDIALLRISYKIPYPVPDLSENVRINIGDDIIMWGYPGAELHSKQVTFSTINNGEISPLLKKGYISGYDDTNPINAILILDCRTAHGFSGSPVYAFNRKDSTWKLVSVMSGGFMVNSEEVRGDKFHPIYNQFTFSSFSFGPSVNYAKFIIDRFVE